MENALFETLLNLLFEERPEARAYWERCLATNPKAKVRILAEWYAHEMHADEVTTKPRFVPIDRHLVSERWIQDYERYSTIRVLDEMQNALRLLGDIHTHPDRQNEVVNRIWPLWLAHVKIHGLRAYLRANTPHPSTERDAENMRVVEQALESLHKVYAAVQDPNINCDTHGII